MSYRSNAAEAWYSDPQPTAAQADIPLDLLPPTSLTQPLWRSLVGNLRDTFAPEKLPPLELTSRPVNVGLALGERLRLPWFRTVFTNIGDVISPETLPPLELESRPVDVGELITDQPSPFWTSFRNRGSCCRYGRKWWTRPKFSTPTSPSPRMPRGPLICNRWRCRRKSGRLWSKLWPNPPPPTCCATYGARAFASASGSDWPPHKFSTWFWPP